MGNEKSSRVSPGVSAAYAAVSFILEVGLLVAAGFAALVFLPWPPLVAVLVVLVPLLVIWSLLLSPKAKIRLRLRTRMTLIHLIYLVGSYTLWLSIARTGETQYLFWPALMLGLTALSLVLVLITGGKAVPHLRGSRQIPVAATHDAPQTVGASTAAPEASRPRGRRAAR